MTIRPLDHTADAGFRVESPDLDVLFAESAEALASLLVERPREARDRRSRKLRIEAERLDDLLHDWLAELLLLFDSEGFLGHRFEARVREAPPHVTARIGGERFDPTRHGAALGVKAVTYHGLFVRRTAGGWTAEVIVDV